MNFKPMTEKYFDSLPDDKKWIRYDPKKGKFWEVFKDNERIGFIGGIILSNKVYVQVYIEDKYRGQNLLPLLYMFIMTKPYFKKYEGIYATVSKDNPRSLKAHSKLFNFDHERDDGLLVYKVK